MFVCMSTSVYNIFIYILNVVLQRMKTQFTIKLYCQLFGNTAHAGTVIQLIISNELQLTDCQVSFICHRKIMFFIVHF